MNLRRTGLLLGIVSAIGVLLVVMAATERKSPGRVSSVHGRIAELDGGESCRKCHGGWFGDMRSACSECHGDIATQLTERRGLHGTPPDLDDLTDGDLRATTDFRAIYAALLQRLGIVAEPVLGKAPAALALFS